jgi:hypothetical protein
MNGDKGVSSVKVLGFGPDTLVLNVRPVDEEGTPVRCELDQDLQAELTLLKERAQREDASIPTRWVFCGEQLFMREKGAQAGFKWVLECPKLIVTVGRGIKTGLWAQARLSSEYLWWCGDLLLAIAHVEEFLERFFGRRIHLQPSSFDLAADCTGWDVSICDVKHEFVFRATSTDELPDTDGLLDGPESIKRRWQRIVGLPFGQRASAVSCLIYDKTHEIKYHSCPIPGIMNKRTREEAEKRGIGIHGTQTQTVHSGVQVESGAGKPATGDDHRRGTQKVRRVDLDDSPVATGISSEGT